MPSGVYQHKSNQGFQKGHKNIFGFQKGHPNFLTEESKRKISESHKGKPSGALGKKNPHSKEHRRKIGEANLGKKRSLETRIRLSETHRGKKCNWWKGGISKINASERENTASSFEYRNWRKQVFERDDYRCFDCGERGGELNAHHIYRFSLFPKLRFVLENGITLCKDCHRKRHTLDIGILVAIA